MPRALIAGNWKMHKTVRETVDFVRNLKEHVSSLQDREVLAAPPYTALHAAATEARGSSIRIAAQNMHWEVKGAFTGEISAGMLIEAGCSHVIIGHSERRRIFGETDAQINLKISAGLQAGLQIIFCIGETLEEREAQQTFNVIKTQLNQGLKNISMGDISRLSVAYEPVWAIGTGKTATPGQAEEAQAFIRSELGKMYSGQSTAETRIIYGGSVTPENIRGLMAEPNVNGVLVGGASLDLESFLKIIRF
jgi:triosephosphate isomerase